MAEKTAAGAYREGPEPRDDGPNPEQVERLRERRDNARWSAAAGFAMLFAASFHIGFAIGGVLMVLYGVVAAFYWGRRLRQLQGDPWDFDPELDGPDAGQEKDP